MENVREKLIKARNDLDSFLNSIPDRVNIVSTEFDNVYNIVSYTMSDDQQLYYDFLIAKIEALQKKVNELNKEEVIDKERKILIDRFVTMYPIELLNEENLERMKKGEIIPMS